LRNELKRTTAILPRRWAGKWSRTRRTGWASCPRSACPSRLPARALVT